MSLKKDQIIKQNLEFVYGRRQEEIKHDLDKRAYIKSAPKLQYTKDELINVFEGDNDFLHPSYPCSVCPDDDYEPYPSYEHALIASKINNENKNELIKEVKSIKAIREAKKFVNKNIGDNSWWKDKCISIAEKLLRDKFFRSKVSLAIM